MAPAPESPASNEPPNGRRPRFQRVLWWGGPGVVAAAGAWALLTTGRWVETDNAYVQSDRITVAPAVAGRVTDVAVADNQAVSAGDPLLTIDPEPFRVALARAQAQLAVVRSQLEASRSSWRAAEADHAVADAEWVHADRALRRQAELRQRGLVPQQALDDAQHDVDTARAKRDSAAAAVARTAAVLGGPLGAADESLPAYRLAESQVAQAKLDLDRTVVRAPRAGVVGPSAPRPGDFLAVGQPALPLMVAGTLRVEANFKETDLTYVTVGQPAEIRIDAYPGRSWRGRVASISPASGAEFALLPAQNATGNWVKVVQRLAVRIALDDPGLGPVLRAGMSATVTVDTGVGHTAWDRWVGRSR